MAALLEVVVCNIGDARQAETGGADRLLLLGDLADQGRSPEPGYLERIAGSVIIPVRPLLRLRPGYFTDGGELIRMQGLASSYLSAGADGVVLGFLNPAGEIDRGVIAEILQACPGLRWSFDRAIDQCVAQDAAWRELCQLPGCDAVITAGSAISQGFDLNRLVSRARSDVKAAELMMAAGGLSPEHLIWLARAGIKQYQLGTQVRESGSFANEVSADLVRTWTILLDS